MYFNSIPILIDKINISIWRFGFDRIVGCKFIESLNYFIGHWFEMSRFNMTFERFVG